MKRKYFTGIYLLAPIWFGTADSLKPGRAGGGGKGPVYGGAGIPELGGAGIEDEVGGNGTDAPGTGGAFKSVGREGGA